MIQTRIPTLDLCIIVAYILAILTIGVLSTRKVKITSKVFFLAGRSLGWGVVGAALFASNISTIHVVGLTASGYNEGLVWGNFEWMAAFTLIVLSLVFAPFYFRNGLSTLPEYLERRYSPASRSILAFMAILAALFMHIGLSIYAGAAVFQEFFGISVYASILIVSLVVCIYTVLGGLKAVVVTESVNTVVLLSGTCIVTVCAIMALPAHGIHSLAQFKAVLRPNQLHMIQTQSREGLNWYAMLLGYPILGIWYWCTDQTIVQRVLGARTERDAQLGPLFAGFLKILPVVFLVFPGVIAYALFRDVIGKQSNQTLPVLINQLVPTGLKGLIAAAVLAALMSGVSAALNSTGTLVAVDIVGRLRHGMSDRAQVTIGRISSCVVMILAVLWSTQGGRFSSIFEAVNIVAADLSPPITAVFLLGVFWRRGTRQASLVTLIIGFVLGAASFVLDLPVFGTEKLISQGLGITFMMQAWWVFCICCVVFVVVSLLTPPPLPQQIEGLVWKNPLAVIFGRKLEGISDPRVVASLLFIVMVILYSIFH